MNERIKELSAIAKNLTTDDALHLSRIHNRTLSLDELGEIFEQKFAELIVRECVKVVLDEDGKEWAGYVHFCREQSADMIKEHFGVK